MDLRLSEEQAAFRRQVREFIASRLPDDIRQRLLRGHPARKQDVVTWQRILHERGWAAPHWPRDYGGAGLGIAERVILLDEIFRAPAPMPHGFNVDMLGPVLLRYGTEAQKRHFLPRLASMDLWFCQGFSEPGAGSDLAALRTRARRDGDHYIVDGQKTWTSSAHHADWVFALVRTDPAAARKQEGISFLLIDLRTPGITIRPIVSIDGLHHLNEVFFDGVHVPAANLVGEEGQGWSVAKYLLANERTGLAHVGHCWERLTYARQLAGDLVRDGRPLIEDVHLREELAWLESEVRALELTNWRFLIDPEVAQRNPGFASVLKLKGSELRQETSALLQRIAGADGLEVRADDGPDALHWAAGLVPRYLYQRAASIFGGSSEVQKDILAKTILG